MDASGPASAAAGAKPGAAGPRSGAAGPPSAALQRRRRRWFWIRWTVRGAALLGVAVALMIGCDSFFYHPSRTMFGTPAAFDLEFEEVTFPARDGTQLSGWFLPARGRPRGTIVHFHGNAENMSTHISFVAWAPASGYNLFVFDYRGYGQSRGSVSRAGTISDGHGALDYVLSRPDVDPARLFILGQSLGGAVATVVAAERPEVRALLLDSTFSSYRRIAALHLQRSLVLEGPARLLAAGFISSGFDPIDYIPRIAPRPLLVIASECDSICFPELSRELFEAAGEPKEYWVVAGGEHTAAFASDTDEAIRRAMRFFDAVAGEPGQ